MSMLIKDFDLSEIKSNFPSVSFECYASRTQAFINCISCEFKSAQSLVEHWDSIQNVVSVYYQPKTEAELWNLYLVLICPEPVDVRHKYIIQNDTYIARKLIVENESVPVESSRAIQILNNELLGFDLKTNFNEVTVDCNYNSTITDLLLDIPLDASVSARSIREKKVELLINYVGKL